MPSKFLPYIDDQLLQSKIGDDEQIIELLVEPLHEELYKRQSFDFLDELSDGQQLMLSFDYVRNQVLQGGFIQLIQNGYLGLLPSMPEWLQMVDAPEMAKVIDDVLKVYVLNIDQLDKETTVEEFARLYDEFKEFEILEATFNSIYQNTLHAITQYTLSHLSDFCIQK
ncbi:MAG: DUF4375 domain-containing protein [Bacteroidota bacterium]